MENAHRDSLAPGQGNVPSNAASVGPDGSHQEDQQDDHKDGITAPKKKPGVLARCFTKLGLDAPTLMMMFKGSLPPTIGIAMYSAPAVSSYFSTLGYLIPIISVLALAILPRGKFIMNLLLSIFAVCFGSAISMLALWSGVQARLNTTPSGAQATSGVTYNSSQSAVCAVWLFANIWLGNAVRSKLPSFNLPIMIYSILVNISATYGPFMTSTAAAEAFIEQLLTAMLVAFALALAVNILVFPVSSRLVVFKEFAGAIALLRQSVSLQKAYLIRLESDDMFAVATRTETSLAMGDRDTGKPKLTKEAKAAEALRGTSAKLAELSGKLHADMGFAKRDIAWGKLDAKDLSEMFTLFRDVYIPIMGMTTIIDIFKRVSERRGWDTGDDAPEEVIAEKSREKRVWNGVMRQMREPFNILSEAIDQGLEHAGLCLELLPRAKSTGKAAAGNRNNADVEAKGEDIRPGEPGFARVVSEGVQKFYSKKGELLKTWMKERALAAEEEGLDGTRCKCSEEWRERERAQLYVVLYMENLMHSSGQAVEKLVEFADRKIADGTMSKKRLILPSSHRLRKWFLAIFSSEDSAAEQAPDLIEAGTSIVYLGDGYNKKKDPEHLAPVTPWQHFGSGLRKVSGFFGSEESAFGFRVACATMTVGIVAFLESTQEFFREQRLVWALIIIAIGMTMTSGQSFFGFLCRVGGTVISMCMSLVIWYIVGEKQPGVIVFLWLSIFIGYYFFLKFPRFTPAIMIAIVTQVLIIGYELQVVTIGREQSERTGQPVYPTYLLAPYRLACVAGGSLVAFFWTVFPKPLTDRTWLRRDLSATLYLVANYFGVINSTLQASLNGAAGDINIPDTPAHQLYKAGRKIFGKVMMLIPSMSQHSEWQKWEPTIGGKFPREAYDDIIVRSTRIMGYLTLISYTLTHPTREPSGDVTDNEGQDTTDGGDQAGLRLPASSAVRGSIDSQAWHSALEEVLIALKPTHHAILSTLTLLSNALLSGQSLPPFVPLPRPYEMTRRLMSQYRNNGGFFAPGVESEDEETVKLVDTRTGEDDCGEPQHASWAQDAEGRQGTPPHILDPRNVDQPGYVEFAVLQVGTTLVCDDLEGLIKAVSGLVGVVDFSFRVSASDLSLSSNGSGDDHGKGGKLKGKAD